MCKYLKPQKSVISSNDVKWIIDEKTGWSTCSVDCAGGKRKIWSAMRCHKCMGPLLFDKKLCTYTCVLHIQNICQFGTSIAYTPTSHYKHTKAYFFYSVPFNVIAHAQYTYKDSTEHIYVLLFLLDLTSAFRYYIFLRIS